MFGIININTLLKFKSWPLKNDSWKTTFLFWPISRRYNFQGVSLNYIQFIHAFLFSRGFYITALFCLRSLLIILMVLVLPLFQLVGSQSNGWRFLETLTLILSRQRNRKQFVFDSLPSGHSLDVFPPQNPGCNRHSPPGWHDIFQDKESLPTYTPPFLTIAS